ncbi:MAG: AAA family ATPase [Verrucomicrobiae bacterium]|nr:AAA family ATPase [Verrucomicrobiae bacterium]
MIIEEFRIQNFKALKDVHLTNLPSMAVFVGKNGTGKTTLFRIFAFLQECLSSNVRVALQREGGLLGFKEVISRGLDPEKDVIAIEIKFRMEIADRQRLVTYRLEIGQDGGKPIVRREILRYKRGQHGSPFHFINFENGKGTAVSNEEDFNRPDEELDREEQTLSSPDILAIKGLGQFDRFKAAKAFRQLIENWHISDIHISSARGAKPPDEGEHVSSRGDNLPAVALRLFNEHRPVFDEVCRKMEQRVPGVKQIEAREMENGSLVIRYRDGAFDEPFLDLNVSDGTIKMFAYLLLLHDPKPHKILCVEEPENQLYPELMVLLAEEFQSYSRRGGQVFISTHSPEFLNAVGLESIFVLEKEAGVSRVWRVQDDPLLADMMKQGEHAGYLWDQGMFAGIGHRIAARP